MRNSRISSIDNVSKNIHYDCAFISQASLFVAASGVTVQGGSRVFQRSKVLARNVTNPNDDEGLVHLIHEIHYRARGFINAAGDATHFTRAQIQRRQIETDLETIENNVNDNVMWEDSIGGQMFSEAAGLAAMVANDVWQNTDYVLKYPLVAVRPYYLDASSVLASSVAGTVTFEARVYLMVESVRVRGEQYRRLLDAYTQLPG